MFRRLIWVAAWFVLGNTFALGAMGYPTPVDPANLNRSPYFYTGMIRSATGSGSGAVAIHPQLALGCGHVNLSNHNTWQPQGSIRWLWRWNQNASPGPSDGTLLTGYFQFSTYRDNVVKHGIASPLSYRKDFVANYSVSKDLAGGYAAGWLDDGKDYLTTGSRSKIISGYPSGRYQSDHPDRYRMHSTEFSQDLKVSSENYLTLNGIETGPGNSGGPAWVWNMESWAFAGVLVSGLHWSRDGRSSIGVCSLNRAGLALICSALGKTGSTMDLFESSVPLGDVPAAIPDKSAISRTFTVSGMLGMIQEVKLNLSVNHQRQGDLIITLRSPSGKTVTILTAVAKNKSSAQNLLFSKKPVAGFSGLIANGTWILTVKDSYRQDTGSIQRGSLEIVSQ